MIRVVREPSGAVIRDPMGKAPGRGAYLHADPSCIDAARKRRALDRALSATVPAELWAELSTLA